MDENMISLAAGALRECLNLRRTEQLLVVCDPPCREIGEAFWEAGARHCAEAVLVQITPRQASGNEPPAIVGELFTRFDVAVMPTSRSLSHTEARRQASAAGTRIATLPGITRESFLRTMATNWRRLGTYTRKLAAKLSRAQNVTVRSEVGTNVTFALGERTAKADDGMINSKGAFGNLPAGEAYCAPLEGTAEGTIVFDGSFPLAGILSEPLVLTVKKGRVTDVGDHPCKDELEKLFKKYGQDSRNIAEFGVGALEAAIISGSTLEDEKVRGTVHIAVGDNASMGGNVHVPLHLDGIIRNPWVWLDDTLWMEKGELV